MKVENRQAYRKQKTDYKNWFGDEDSLDGSQEDEVEGEEEWARIGRKEKNKEKKKKRKIKNRKLQASTSLKARDILGIGPIKQEVVNKLFRDGRDYEAAKRMVVQDFLMRELQYEE